LAAMLAAIHGALGAAKHLQNGRQIWTALCGSRSRDHQGCKAARPPDAAEASLFHVRRRGFRSLFSVGASGVGLLKGCARVASRDAEWRHSPSRLLEASDAEFDDSEPTGRLRRGFRARLRVPMEAARQLDFTVLMPVSRCSMINDCSAQAHLRTIQPSGAYGCRRPLQ
jgi:hypothetical protein